MLRNVRNAIPDSIPVGDDRDGTRISSLEELEAYLDVFPSTEMDEDITLSIPAKGFEVTFDDINGVDVLTYNQIGDALIG